MRTKIKTIEEIKRRAIKGLKIHYSREQFTDHEILDEFKMLIRRRDNNILFDNDEKEVFLLSMNGVDWEEMDQFIKKYE